MLNKLGSASIFTYFSRLMTELATSQKYTLYTFQVSLYVSETQYFNTDLHQIDRV